MATTETIDTSTEAFARRLANLVRDQRAAAGLRLGEVARRSDGRFTVGRLREIEAGRTPLEADEASEVAALYGADLDAILPARLELEVDPGGTLHTAGVTAAFRPGDSTSLLVAYLHLVRRLRDQQRAPVVDLRRADVDVLAAVLDEPGETVVERLAVLMDATRTQRKAMAALFVAGAAVIGLATTAVAVDPGTAASSGGGWAAAPSPVPYGLVAEAPAGVVSDVGEIGAPATSAVPLTIERDDPAPPPIEVVTPAVVPPSVVTPAVGPTEVATPAVDPVVDIAPVDGSGDVVGDAGLQLERQAPPVVVGLPVPVAPVDPPTSDAAADERPAAPTAPPAVAPPPVDAVSPPDPSPVVTGPPVEVAPPVEVGPPADVAPPVEPGPPADVAPPVEPAPPAEAAPPVDEEAPPSEQVEDGTPVMEAEWEVVRGRAEVGDDGTVELTQSNGERRVLATDRPMVDGRITVDADLSAGPGFGVWVRSQFDDRGRVVSGWTVQVDPGFGRGALLVRRWVNDREAAPVARTTVAQDELRTAEHLVVDLDGQRLRAVHGAHEVVVDDLAAAAEALGDRWVADDGDTVGLRAWGSTDAIIHEVVLDPADDLPADDLPAEDVPAEDVPAEDVPAGDPAEDAGSVDPAPPT